MESGWDRVLGWNWGGKLGWMIDRVWVCGDYVEVEFGWEETGGEFGV